jgi:hypothetical protein
MAYATNQLELMLVVLHTDIIDCGVNFIEPLFTKRLMFLTTLNYINPNFNNRSKSSGVSMPCDSSSVSSTRME